MILDGVERVERNVLPVLNNLLENREAQLEDGRFLMSPGRFDQLAASSSVEELVKSGLVRVDEAFRVIALGLPVPLFRGAPLDPPLRSRFQARQVEHSKYGDVRNECLELGANQKTLDELLAIGYAINTEEARDLGVGVFPTDMTSKVASLPTTSFPLFRRLFPYTAGNLGDTAQDQIDQLIRRLEMPLTSERDLKINSISKSESGEARVVFETSSIGNQTLNYAITPGQNPTSDKNENFYGQGGRDQSLGRFSKFPPQFSYSDR